MTAPILRTKANTYRLPDGPCAIQFSGGRTSGYMLWLILDAHGGQLPPDAHVLFQNTGREMPETLRFVEECGRRWGAEIAWLEYHRTDDGAHGWRRVGPGTNTPASINGEPFEAVCRGRSYLPNRVTRFCTSELKVRPAKKYMQWLGYSSWTAAIGFRADEPRRVHTKDDSKQCWTSFFPLYHAGVTKRDVSAWWSQQSFNLGLPDNNGKTALGNCDGCFLKSEANNAFLARYYPERAAWWAEMERRHRASFHAERTWGGLIDHAQAQPDWVFDTENDVYCASTFGGCHD